MIEKPKFYVTAMVFTVLVAIAPIAFNAIVDPYDRNRLIDLDLDKGEISVKAHYPLYKMIEYPRILAPTVILGDSRARALKDSHWQELGRNDVYNFAYGGATVYEIYDTFNYLRENADLETLIISLPLRSMDKRFKGSMNRVPEAIDLARNPFGYYSNWFVSKVGWRLLEDRYPALFDADAFSLPSLVSAANAGAFGVANVLSVEDLLDPDLCESCTLRTPSRPIVLPTRFHHHGAGLDHWHKYWPEIRIDRDLPQLFSRQVGTNGAADWRRFKQSPELWSKIEEIAAWCAENKVELIFLIPPTVSEMQRRIADFGLAPANHRYRERLSALAPVVDLDFDTAFTRDLANFKDAYHFGSGPARQIVGELLQLIDPNSERANATTKNRKSLSCPVRESDITDRHSDGSVELLQGQSCRIWRQANG